MVYMPQHAVHDIFLYITIYLKINTVLLSILLLGCPRMGFVLYISSHQLCTNCTDYLLVSYILSIGM